MLYNLQYTGWPNLTILLHCCDKRIILMLFTEVKTKIVKITALLTLQSVYNQTVRKSLGEINNNV